MTKKIFIDPGHSKVDPGAVGFEIERDLNEKVSAFMNEYLLANYECETKIDPVTTNSTITVTNAANEWGADLFVSNHFNAGGGDGYEALVYSAETKPLGNLFVKHVMAIGQNSRGVKFRPSLNVLKLTNMPAILNEGAFVDNKKDIQDWNDDAELKKLGEAYAKAAAEYLDLPKKINIKVETESKSETVTTTEKLYRVQTGAFSKKKNADAEYAKVKASGFDAYMIKSGNYYKIQVGAFKKKANAVKMKKKLSAAGFSTFITTTGGKAVATKK